MSTITAKYIPRAADDQPEAFSSRMHRSPEPFQVSSGAQELERNGGIPVKVSGNTIHIHRRTHSVIFFAVFYHVPCIAKSLVVFFQLAKSSAPIIQDSSRIRIFLLQCLSNNN